MPNIHEIAATGFRNHPLYGEFVQVKNQLKAQGFVCWVAGGAVRDLLLGRTVADFDLVTDATTDQLITLFPNAVLVGAQFGVIKLNLQAGGSFDLATFRRESDYTDGRRPSKVDYATPEEDSKRRDFTMNALFWNDEKLQVIDFEHGLPDILKKMIKCVGIPLVRFQEDYLRILRLLRFSVQLQFRIDPETLRAALTQVKSLEKISGERIWSEISKMAPDIKWSDFFKTDFNKIIFKSLFPIEIENIILPAQQLQLELSDRSPSSAVLKLFYFLILFSKSEDVLLKLLKNRLHLSRTEIDLFVAIQFCRKHCQEMTVNHWLYEIEKKPGLLEILNFLSDIGVKDDFQQIVGSYEHRPQKLFDGNDLKGKISPVDTAATLKKIRLLQFEQPYLTKSEIFEYLNQNKIIST